MKISVSIARSALQSFIMVASFVTRSQERRKVNDLL